MRVKPKNIIPSCLVRNVNPRVKELRIRRLFSLLAKPINTKVMEDVINKAASMSDRGTSEAFMIGWVNVINSVSNIAWRADKIWRTKKNIGIDNAVPASTETTLKAISQLCVNR